MLEARNESKGRDKQLRMRQAEKQISRRRGDGDEIVRSVVGNAAAGLPIGRRQNGILLQCPARRGIRPGNPHAVTGMSDGQRRRTGGLHDGNKTPETAGRGIISAAHRNARIRLANRAADRILAVAARAATAGDFMPVNGVLLRMKTEA